MFRSASSALTSYADGLSDAVGMGSGVVVGHANVSTRPLWEQSLVQGRSPVGRCPSLQCSQAHTQSEPYCLE